MKIALPAAARPFIEGRLPSDLEPAWYADNFAALEAVRGAEIGWIDVLGPPGVGAVIDAAWDLKWMTTSFAGVATWPLDGLLQRGVVLTNGAGVTSIPVAEFAVMGMLVMAKNMRELIYAQDRKAWPRLAPGVGELYESRALVIGYGSIGREIGRRLAGFGVKITGVRRHPGGEEGIIGPDDWRDRLGEFDWVVLASPGTEAMRHMIGRTELGRMKPSAFLVNIARGVLIDQAALIEAVTARTVAGAFLDVTDPEPPWPDDPIWSTPGIVMTCHTSGRSQTRLIERASALFLDNLARWRAGEPMLNVVDLAAGY